MSNFRLATYNPDQVLIYWSGNLIQGYDDDEFISVEQMSPGYDDVVGTDGEVARSRTNDRRLKVTIKLLQTSLSNQALSLAHTSDLNAPNGAGVGALFIQDTSGFSIVKSPQSWVVQYPNSSYARKAKGREWEIRCAFGTRFEGGN